MEIKDISTDWEKYKIRPGNPPMRKTTSIDLLVIHHTADNDDIVGKDVYKIINYHTHPNHVCSTGCWTMCYHYYIENVEEKPIVWHAVPDHIVTFHAGKWNKRSLGIVVDGDKDSPIESDKGKYESTIQLLADLCIKYDLNPYIAILGHKHLYWYGWKMNSGKFMLNTECPGALDIKRMRQDVSDLLSTRGYISAKIDLECMVYKGENFLTEERYDQLSAQFNNLDYINGPNREPNRGE